LKLISSAIGIAILIYLGYIAIAPTPVETLNRICDPAFTWPKKFLASGNGFGRCRAWGWNLLYEEEYQKTQRAEKSEKSDKAASTTKAKE
jgi:hypothetical protein